MGRRTRKRSLSGGDDPAPPASKGATDAPTSSRAERDAERRRRRAELAAAGAAGSKRRPARRRATRERPPAPWGSLPLSELVVALALVLGVVSFLVRGQQGTIMLIAAFALGSLAGLELAVREHFAGYRSHSTLLAASAGFAAGGVIAVLLPGPAPRALIVVVAVVAFGLAFRQLREAFKRRSGGLGFR